MSFEWAAVEDKLPRDNPHRVLMVVYRNGEHRTPRGVKAVARKRRIIRFAMYSGGAFRFISHNDKTRLSERVTHWSRLPRLPSRARARPI